MRKKISFITIVFSVLLIACNNNNDHRITKANQLINELDSTKTEMQTLDSSVIAVKFETYMHNIQSIQEVFDDTNHTEKEWNLLTQYATIKKPLKDYPRNYSIFMKNLKYSITQIESLIYEYKEGSIDSTKFDSYYQTEEEIAYDLMMQIQFSLSKTKESSEKYDSLNPQIEIYLEEKTLHD